MNKHQLERFDNLQVHARLLGGACLSKKYGKCTDRLRWRCAEGLHLAGRRLGGRLVVRSPARAGRRAAGRRLGPGGGVGFVAERRMVASSVSGGGAEFIAQGRRYDHGREHRRRYAGEQGELLPYPRPGVEVPGGDLGLTALASSISSGLPSWSSVASPPCEVIKQARPQQPVVMERFLCSL